LATDACASFNGPLDLGFKTLFVAGLVVALPGGLVCVVTEWVGAVRQPPLWIGRVALTLGLLGLASLAVANPGGQLAACVVFGAPPVMTLALVTLLPAPRWRLGAVWLVSLASIYWIDAMLRPSGAPPPRTEMLGALQGGAVTHLLLWHAGFVLGQLARHARGLPPPPRPNLQRFVDAGWYGWQDAKAVGGAVANRIHVHPGFWWWLGGAAVFYVALLWIAVRGPHEIVQSAIVIGQQLRLLFNLPWINGPTASWATMWLTYGLFWSAIVGGGVWGVAASLGRFDAGRLAPLRLVAIGASAVMLAWLAHDVLTRPVPM
jgi:hypothetical protein